jgi:dihydropteroate synthase
MAGMFTTPHDSPPLTLADRFPERSRHWRLQRTTLPLGNVPLLMGVVNVTPDSFSDGGRFYSTSRAVERALRLVEQGADLLDVGGESTRPYATPVDDDEELRRVVGVIQQICDQTSIPVSIDTSKACVAQQALEAGAQVINDVTALTGDALMIGVALKYDAGVCAMHMQGTPQTMQQNPHYDDVVREVGCYLQQRRDALLAAGIGSDRICLDPGIGFGKTHQHNLTLMAHCGQYHQLGCPLLVGHSRKGFIAKLLGDTEGDRLPGTIGASLALARQGVQLLRVHDVRPIREALQLFEACGGIDGRERQLPDRDSTDEGKTVGSLFRFGKGLPTS